MFNSEPPPKVSTAAGATPVHELSHAEDILNGIPTGTPQSEGRAYSLQDGYREFIGDDFLPPSMIPPADLPFLQPYP